MPIHIDSEFAALIPSQSDDENKALEQSLLSEGCRDALVVWKGHDILLDGHNRYAICQRHNIPFRTLEREFETREDVIIWICQNQLARRNITTYTRSKLALKMKDVFEAQAKAKQSEAGKTKVSQNSDEALRTDEAVAEIAEVSRDTVRKVEKVEAEAPEQVKEAAGTGEISVNRAYNITLALKNAPPEYVDDILKLSSDEPEKIETLKRLYTTRGNAGSNGTFDEIITTGGFAYGDEMDKWCNYTEATMAEITKGLTSIAQHHAVINTKPHVSHNSGENEWYTPPEYIAAARAVLGTIDLDPASSEIANKTVQATTFYTVDDSGLDHDWRGKVWMNPPYASELIRRFTSKLNDHVRAGDVTEGIVLVNNATETALFLDLVSVASAVVFTAGRVKFIDVNGKATGAPLQGQAILYIGGKPKTFLHEFRPFGWSATL